MCLKQNRTKGLRGCRRGFHSTDCLIKMCQMPGGAWVDDLYTIDSFHYCNKMDEPFDQLSATALRNLLITETKTFVAGLDTIPHERLQEMRNRLIAIYKLLTEKEQLEMLPLVWGRNSAYKQADGGDGLPAADILEIMPTPNENGPAGAEPS